MMIFFRDKNLRPLKNKVLAGERFSFEDGLTVMNSPDLLGVGALANNVRERMHGDNAYYINNRHINPTNICVASCQFCAFGVKENNPDAYEMTVDQVVESARSHMNGKVSEFHLVGGLHPSWPFDTYVEIIKQLHDNFPDVHLQAFTAVEIDYLTEISGLSIREVLTRLRDVGLGSLPGGGAEIFNPKIRRKICAHKATGERWLEIHRTAHQIGMQTNCTMLYGHIESPEDRINHFIQLRDLQDETGGFMTFIPLAFHPENTAFHHLPRTTGQMDLRMLAVGRLMLDNIPHIKAFWIMITPKIAQMALSFGADDMDGTVVEEKIIHAAGALTEQETSKNLLIDMIREAGRVPVERDTVYNVVA